MFCIPAWKEPVSLIWSRPIAADPPSVRVSEMRLAVVALNSLAARKSVFVAFGFRRIVPANVPFTLTDAAPSAAVESVRTQRSCGSVTTFAAEDAAPKRVLRKVKSRFSVPPAGSDPGTSCQRPSAVIASTSTVVVSDAVPPTSAVESFTRPSRHTSVIGVCHASSTSSSERARFQNAICWYEPENILAMFVLALEFFGFRVVCASCVPSQTLYIVMFRLYPLFGVVVEVLNA